MSSDECSAAAAADGGERRDPSEKQEPHTVMWGIKERRRGNELAHAVKAHCGQGSWGQCSCHINLLVSAHDVSQAMSCKKIARAVLAWASLMRCM